MCWERQVRPFLDDHQQFDEEALERHHQTTVASAVRERREWRWLHPSEALRDQFGVSGASVLCNVTLDPRLARPPQFDGSHITEVGKQADPVQAPKVLLEFDLSLPLEVQLDNARRWLTRRARRAGTMRRVTFQVEKFPAYLRLLDFEELGTPDKEIGEHLFPNQSGDKLRDTIRKALTAAQRWQDDYRAIALHSAS
jgi:hypothetical protein